MKPDTVFENFTKALIQLRYAMSHANVQDLGAEITIGLPSEADVYHFQDALLSSADLRYILPMASRYGTLGHLVGFDVKFEVRKPTTATVKMPDGSVRHLRPGESLTIETKAK